jgi:hypothetical protein
MSNNVLIGLPTMGSVHPVLVTNIAIWIAEAFKKADKGLSLYPTLGIVPVDNARNKIVDMFLEGDFTHLWFIDSDTIPPQDALDKLLAIDADIVSAITPIIEVDSNTGRPYRKWNCVGMDDKLVKPDTGVVQVKGAGTSCMLIKRSVFEQIEKPYFRFAYTDDKGKECLISEDIHFIIQALSKGIKTYADTSIICRHAKTVIM